MPPRFSASSFWNQQCEYDATLVLRRANDPPDTGWLELTMTVRRVSHSGSSGRVPPRLAPAVFDNLESRFGAPVLEAYGMTEAAHQMSSSPMPPGDRYPGTVGLPTGLDVAVMSDTDSGQFADTDLPGEVVIRGRAGHVGLPQQRRG